MGDSFAKNITVLGKLLPEFAAKDDENPDDWLNAVERAFTALHVNEQDKDVYVLLIEQKLTGKAHRWMVAQDRRTWTFETFRKEFLAKFYSAKKKKTFLSRYDERRLKADESVEAYGNDLLFLLAAAGEKLSEAAVVSKFITGLYLERNVFFFLAE